MKRAFAGAGLDIGSIVDNAAGAAMKKQSLGTVGNSIAGVSGGVLMGVVGMIKKAMAK